jgi:hypothetical protein
VRPVLQKRPRYIDKSLTGLAKLVPCQFTFQHECSRDTMACHSNWLNWNKGVGLKCSDWAWAAGCLVAHREIDGKINPKLTKDERQYYWMEAFISTQDYLWRNRLLRVA